MYVMFIRSALMCGILLVYSVTADLPRRRFEYKLSFKGPHMVQKDGSVPFWEFGGDAIASDDNIRITPSLRSKKGWVWTKSPLEAEHWEVEIIFRVTGRGRIGADGLAVWFTEQKGINGPVYGSSDRWNGLGVIFDSFDNDGQHNNPYILAVPNDGTRDYDHQNDGLSQQIGGCLRDFRNKPFPVRAKIEYYQKTLTILYHTGMNNNLDQYEFCMRAVNVNLPKVGYFGITAATGGLADDHDVTAFLTHTLHPPVDPQKPVPEGKFTEDEKLKYEKEFDEYYEKLKLAKEDYKQQHPDQVTDDPYDVPDDKWFESQNERELKQIFEGQDNMNHVLKNINQKLDEIVGRQERTLSQLANMAQSGPVVAGQAGQPGQQMMIDTIKRHEVDSVLGNQREIKQTVFDIRNVVNEVKQHSLQQVATGGQQQQHHQQQQQHHQQQQQHHQKQQQGGFDSKLIVHEVQDSLRQLREDTNKLINRPVGMVCPPQQNTNCLTPMYFLIFMSAQCAIVIGYIFYRSSKEAQAKKFY